MSRVTQPGVDLTEGESGPWESRALCAQTDPELFYPEKGHDSRPAKRICNRCEVAVDCLADALDGREPYGVRGGLPERQRRALLKAGVTGDVVRARRTTVPALLMAPR
ncbi:WhiB family transcriptional regulator [Micromonospora haikouensis]|uniref:WhiB family transcriptional regulator n=1 Tax=Micromonospora haikouensis TaxID=686309 RepID=UPI0033D40C6E